MFTVQFHTTKDKLVTWLRSAERAAKSSAARANIGEVRKLYEQEAVDIAICIRDVETGQMDLAQTGKK